MALVNPGLKTRVLATQRKLNNRQVRQVQKIVEGNKQIKRLNTSVNGTFTTTGDLYELTAIAKSNTNLTRDSDRINLLQAELEVGFYSDTAGYKQLRIMMVRGKYGPLVLADFPDIVTTPDYDKMQVYHDRVYTIGPGSTNFDSSVIHRVNLKKQFKNRKVPHLNVIYDTDVSATAAQDNPIYIYFIQSSANAITSSGYGSIKWFDKD